MAVDKLGKQMYPGMLSEADKDYIPDPSHLFPVVVIRKLTGKEINEAYKGIYPIPSGEANSIRIDNVRRHVNDNYETFNDAGNASAILMTDDIPDDPFIDDIDSDDSDLPDLSNIAAEGEKRVEKKDKITDKKGFNGKNEEEERPRPSDKKTDKLKHKENGKIKKKSNEIIDTKQSEKDGDQNKIFDKDRIKNGKRVNDNRVHDIENKENKTQSGLLENLIQSDSSMELRDKEKVLSIDNLSKSDKNASENDKSINISSTSKDFSSSCSKSSSSKKSAKSSTDSVKLNSNPIPSAEPKVNVLSSIADLSIKLKDKEEVPCLNDIRMSDLRNSDKNKSENDNGTNFSSTSSDFSSSCSKSSSDKNSAKSATDNVKINSDPTPSAEPKVNVLSSIADSSTKMRDKEMVSSLDDLKMSDLSKSERNTSENDKGTNSSSNSKKNSSSCSKSSSSKKPAKSSTDSVKFNSNPLPSVEPPVNILSSIVDSSTKLKDKEEVPSSDNLKMSGKSSGNISDSDSSSKSKDLPSVSSKSFFSQTSTKSTEFRMSDKISGDISDSDSSSKSKDISSVSSKLSSSLTSTKSSSTEIRMSDKSSVDLSDSDSSSKSKVLPSVSSKSSLLQASTKSSTEIRMSDKSSEDISDINSKLKDPSSVSSKLSSSQASTKTSTEIIKSMNSNPVPSVEPKISLLPFLAKTRAVKKQKAIGKEQKVLNSIQFSIPVFIKSEPVDITDPGDSMAIEAPLLNSQQASSSFEPGTKTHMSNGETNPQPSSISSLLNDGEFNSQIDSDQETVDFGETQEKNHEDDNEIENRNSRKEGNEKISDKIEKTRINDTNDDKDNNKRKSDQINRMEKRNSREEESKNNLDEIKKTRICNSNDFDNKNKRNREDINAMESKNSQEEKNEKTVYQVENKRSDKDYDKEENKRKRDSSDSAQEKKKLKGDSSKMEVEINKDKKDSNSDSSSQIVTKPIPILKRIIDIESKTNLEESKGIKEKEGSKLVTELAIKNVPQIAAVPIQEVEKPACTPPTMISKSSLVNSEATIVQSSSVTQPLISPADVSEKDKSTPVSFSAFQSKEERIKALKKIAGMCKSIMKKHSFEEKLQNECEEVKRKIIFVESRIFEIQKEEERRMAELDILHTQLDDIDDEEKIAELAEKMIDLTDCTEIRERKSNLEKEKRKLVSEQDIAENSLQEAKAERKREELEMASLKASLNSISRRNGPSCSPGPEMGDSNNSKQICVSSAPFSHSANNPAVSQMRTISGREQQQQQQQQQILQNLLPSQQQYQHPHIRQEQPQGVVATLGEQMLYQTENGPPDCRQISCNEDMVLIPKSKFDLMQKDEMQRMMQIPVSRQMIQRQETIIKTYQSDMRSMGTIQQQQMMDMQQGQGLIQHQQDMSQQSFMQATPSSIVPHQTTMMAPQQQVSRVTSGQPSVIMVPQQSPEGIVEQIGMSQQNRQTTAINKPGNVIYPSQGFQTGPVSGMLHQQQLSSNNNTQQTIMKQSSGQDMVTHHAKESSLQPMKPREQPRMSTSQLVMPGQSMVSSPQHMMPSGQSMVSSPQYMMPSGQAMMSGPHHVVMSGQTKVSSPQHVIPSDQARMSSPHPVVMPGQTKVSSPQHVIPSGQTRMSSPHPVVMPGQTKVSSPQHVIPSGQARMSSPHPVMMPGQTKVSSPQHMMPSGQARMSSPHHLVMPGQNKVSSSQHVLPSSQARLSSPPLLMMPGQARISNPQSVMSVQPGTSSPQLVSSLRPPPPYSEALTQVASVASSQSPAAQHQNKISNSISENSVLSQILQAPQITQANSRPYRPESISKKPGSHNHLQVQALQTQQTIMNDQRQRRLMSQGKADSTSGEGRFKCECGATILNRNLFEAHYRRCKQKKRETNSDSCQETAASIPSGTQHSASIPSGSHHASEPNFQQVLQVGDKHHQIQSQVPITVPTMAQVHNIPQSQPTNVHVMQSQQLPHKEDTSGTDSKILQDDINKNPVRKCPTPGCDGKGNTDSRRFTHISALCCPSNPRLQSKTIQTPQNVSNVSAAPCTSSSFAVMMAPNQVVPDVNMDDATTPPQPTCFLCGKHGEFTCCGDTIYCGVDCQEADFDRHQVECKNVNEEY